MPESPDNVRDIPPDLAPYSSEKPEKKLHLLFIHHSCGGQLLAEKGDILEKYPGSCIYITHPNGGKLRTALERNNYLVHESSYRSALGLETDVCSWRKKFGNRMQEILSCVEQDSFFCDGTRNRVVMFKSCYPNSWIDSPGKEPGDPDSGERTTANYKASYLSLLPHFQKHQDTLFIAWTAPPMARPATSPKVLALSMLRRLQGRSDHVEAVGSRIRSFNRWMKDMDHGWLKGYKNMNAVVFDYYEILTGYGQSDWSRYPTRGGLDSHPSSEGNTRAANSFIPFLNKAVKRAGL
jgi:hypothetical protein